MKRKNKHTGSKFDDFLLEQGIYQECSVAAIKFMLARELEKKIERENLSKTEVAKELETSRSGIVRILDDKNESITLATLSKVAFFVGKRLEIKLV